MPPNVSRERMPLPPPRRQKLRRLLPQTRAPLLQTQELLPQTRELPRRRSLCSQPLKLLLLQRQAPRRKLPSPRRFHRCLPLFPCLVLRRWIKSSPPIRRSSMALRQ